MSVKNSRVHFVVTIIFVLTSVSSCSGSVGWCVPSTSSCTESIPADAWKTSTAWRISIDYKLMKYIDSIVGSLAIPLSSEKMNSYEQAKLADVSERKTEILRCLNSLLLESCHDLNVQDRNCYVKERSLPLFGAIGAMLQNGASVKHLWPSDLQWLRFKSSCESGQSLAARIRAMRRGNS